MNDLDKRRWEMCESTVYFAGLASRVLFDVPRIPGQRVNCNKYK